MFKMLQHVWSQGPGNTSVVCFGLRLMHGDLHWLVIPQRVHVQACCNSPSLSSAPNSKVPHQLRYCMPVSVARQHLRSARCQLSVPRVHRSTYETSAFSVVEPTVRNSLPDHLLDPAVDSKQFRRDLKTYGFAGH